MSKPIIDKAEVSIEFPDKFYHGSFGRDCRFDVTADEHGAHISLDRAGEDHRHVEFHLHYHLLGDILKALGPALTHTEMLPHEREALQNAARELDKTLGKKPRARSKQT